MFTELPQAAISNLLFKGLIIYLATEELEKYDQDKAIHELAAERDQPARFTRRTVMNGSSAKTGTATPSTKADLLEKKRALEKGISDLAGRTDYCSLRMLADTKRELAQLKKTASLSC